MIVSDWDIFSTHLVFDCDTVSSTSNGPGVKFSGDLLTAISAMGQFK